MTSVQQFFGGEHVRQQLLEKKLGDLLTWRKPEVLQSVGPFDPGAFDAFDAARADLVRRCVQKLTDYTGDQAADIYDVMKSGNSIEHDWPRYLADEITKLLKRIPSPFAGGFGNAEFVADFDYWTIMPHFTISELTSLSVGIEPREFSWTTLEELSASEDRSKFLAAHQFLLKRFEQLRRNFSFKGRDTQVMPSQFIRWIDHFKFEVHPGFLGPLKEFHSQRNSPGPDVSTRKQDKREVDSVAQLFTAMAIEHFGYDPRQTRSPTTREVSNLAASLGMTIADDTILKFLRLGAEFISADWTPPKR